MGWLTIPGLPVTGDIHCQVMNWQSWLDHEVAEYKVWGWGGGDVAQVVGKLAREDRDVRIEGHLMRVGPFETLIRDYDPSLDTFIVQRMPSFGEN